MSAKFKNAKKKNTQHELRRLMNEQKSLIKQNIKKVESPLAKYSETGQLTCVLCKTIVRSEAVWPVHVNAKQHKENIAIAKRLKEETKNFTTVKRSQSPLPDNGNKHVKGILKNGPAKEGVPAQIPSDFFDAISKAKGNVHKPPAKKKAKLEETMEIDEADVNSEVLPEGFFDDPIKDAKARNLEYKDPVEEEWEKFQREMKDVNSASAAIIAEDQEEATTERQIDEIDEQIRNWSRVLDLERKKEAIKKEANEEAIRQEADKSSGDEDDFDEYLDWRSKNSFK